MSIFLPRHLSVSSVSLYVECAARWKQRYVDRVVTPSTAPQATGTAFHKALEAEHKGLDADLIWIAAADEANDALAASGESITMSKEHGLKLLARFRERGMNVVCPAEVKFLLPFPGGRIPVPLLGYVDAFAPDFTDEYKTTGSNWWTQAKADMSLQGHVYGWVRQRVKRERRPVRFVIFSTNKLSVDVLEVLPSPDAFRSFEAEAEGMWSAISAGEYPPCGTCDVCKPPVENPAGTGPAFAWGA